MLYRSLFLALSFLSLVAGCAKKQPDASHATDNALHTGASGASPLQCDLAKGNPLFRDGQNVLIEGYHAEDTDDENCSHADTGYDYLQPPYGGDVCDEISTEKCVMALKVANDQACVSQVFCHGTLKGNIYLDKEMVGFVHAKDAPVPSSGEEIQQWVDTLKKEVGGDAYNTIASSKEFTLAFREDRWEETDGTEGGLTKGWTTLEGNTWTDEQFGDSEWGEETRVIYDPGKGIFSYESCITAYADGIRIIAVDK